MASYILLESYIHVVYENKKNIKKNFFEKYFSDDENFEISKFSKIFEILPKSLSKWGQIYLRIFEKTRNFHIFFEISIFFIARKIFFEKVFSKLFFCFRKLHGYSYLTSCWTPSNSFWSLRTSNLHFGQKNTIYTLGKKNHCYMLQMSFVIV